MNCKVSELINEITKYDGITKYTYEPSGNDLEARLLRLDISKAINKLGWMPVLDFQSTVKYTTDGYLSDLVGNSSLKNRIETINAYKDIAKIKSLHWT